MKEVVSTFLAQSYHRRSTPSRRVDDLLASQPELQEVGTPRYKLWFTQEPAHSITTPCTLTLTRASLALSLTKLMLNLRM
jgi:hypothetical protein